MLTSQMDGIVLSLSAGQGKEAARRFLGSQEGEGGRKASRAVGSVCCDFCVFFAFGKIEGRHTERITDSEKDGRAKGE